MPRVRAGQGENRRKNAEAGSPPEQQPCQNCHLLKLSFPPRSRRLGFLWALWTGLASQRVENDPGQAGTVGLPYEAVVGGDKEVGDIPQGVVLR